MSDDAVIRLGYDNSKVRAGARETENTMRNAAHKVHAHWNETSKKLKDVFEPTSRGALVHAGAIGVAFYGAKLAIGTFRETVENLAKAEYLTPTQREQMQHIATQFERVDQFLGKITARAIGGAFDFLSKGKFSKASEADAAGAEWQKQSAMISQIATLETAAAEEQMSNAEKLQRRKEQLLELEAELQKEMDKHPEGELARAQSQTKVLEITKRKLELEREAARLQKEVAADDQKKQTASKSISADLKILEARAAGHEKVAKALERQKAIEERATAIARETGMDAAHARGLAEQEQELRDKIEKRGSRGRAGRRRIAGYSGAQRKTNRFLDKRGFNEFFHPEETANGQRTTRDIWDQNWDETFHRRERGRDIHAPKAPLNSATTITSSVKTLERTPSHDESRRLLERIAEGIENLQAE